jgi:hypothetical protein
MKRAVLYLFTTALLLGSFCAASADEPAIGPVIDLKASALDGRIKLEWCKPKDVEGTLDYEVYRKSQAGILVAADIVPANRVGIMGSDGGCLEFVDTAVKSGKSYSYAVIVVDGSGNRSVISKSKDDNVPVAAMP